MYTITKRLEFDYGHRVLGHEGQCACLHGHRGVAEITVAPGALPGSGLDKVGRVIDFSVIKLKIGIWITQNWDHNFLCHRDDPLMAQWQWEPDQKGSLFNWKRPYVMSNGMNPTAECMAQELFMVGTGLLARFGIKVVKVRFYETPSSFADYTLPPG